MNYDYVFRCRACGAVTVCVDGEEYYMPRKEFNRIFNAKGKRIVDSVYSCNYCVNHWGIDLCVCGSGEKYWKCKEGYDVCGKPDQVLGEKTERVLFRF